MKVVELDHSCNLGVDHCHTSEKESTGKPIPGSLNAKVIDLIGNTWSSADDSTSGQHDYCVMFANTSEKPSTTAENHGKFEKSFRRTEAEEYNRSLRSLQDLSARELLVN